MQYTLGADETQPAAPFLRIVAPTDIQKVSQRIADTIKGYYPGIDLLNLSLWRKLGASALEGPVILFLQRVIAEERSRTDSLTRQNGEYFLDALLQKYGYRPDDLADYVKAYIEVLEAGYVPESISRPWEYEPTTAAQDVAAVVSQSIMPALLPLVLGGIAVYAAVTVLAPKLILRKA